MSDLKQERSENMETERKDIDKRLLKVDIDYAVTVYHIISADGDIRSIYYDSSHMLLRWLYFNGATVADSIRCSTFSATKHREESEDNN